MSRRKAEAVLVIIVMATSASYLFTKLGTDEMPVFCLLAFRFTIAFGACFLIFARHIKHANRLTFFLGAMLGMLMFALLAAQAFGLATISTTNGSFLSSTTVVIVPLLMAILTKKLPGFSTVVGAIATMIGIALLTGVQEVPLAEGALLYLASAFLYAVHIILIDRFAHRIDALACGIIELGFAAIPSAACMMLFEGPHIPTTASSWLCLLALGLLCTALGMAMQPAIQQHTSPERYGMLFGLGPLFSALLGIVFLGDGFTTVSALGAALILFGTLFAIAKGNGARTATAKNESIEPPVSASHESSPSQASPKFITNSTITQAEANNAR